MSVISATILLVLIGCTSLKHSTGDVPARTGESNGQLAYGEPSPYTYSLYNHFKTTYRPESTDREYESFTQFVIEDDSLKNNQSESKEQRGTGFWIMTILGIVVCVFAIYLIATLET
jgi:hypothetical protein